MLKRVVLKNGFIFNGKNIYLQSMLKKPADDIKANIKQAELLQEAGCDIIRVSIPTLKDVVLIKELKKNIKCPIVADVHFDHNIAIKAAECGVDKIRINPCNITKKEHLEKIAQVCKYFGVAIRIGINSGSLEKDLLKEYGGVTADALVSSALKNVRLFEEDFGFENIVVSIKSSDVGLMIDSCRKFSKISSYPMHIGVTEASLKKYSIVKSSIGIGALLVDKIGQTLRVSITGDPLQEVKIGFLILKALNIRKNGIDLISCPTCARTKTDILKLTQKVDEILKNCNKNLKVAIMGCSVNGPGEAKMADIGVAGGDGYYVLFKKGKILKKVKQQDVLKVLISEIEKM